LAEGRAALERWRKLSAGMPDREVRIGFFREGNALLRSLASALSTIPPGFAAWQDPGFLSRVDRRLLGELARSTTQPVFVRAIAAHDEKTFASAVVQEFPKDYPEIEARAHKVLLEAGQPLAACRSLGFSFIREGGCRCPMGLP
jgi:hypothetical protein